MLRTSGHHRLVSGQQTDTNEPIHNNRLWGIFAAGMRDYHRWFAYPSWLLFDAVLKKETLCWSAIKCCIYECAHHQDHTCATGADTCMERVCNNCVFLILLLFTEISSIDTINYIIIHLLYSLIIHNAIDTTFSITRWKNSKKKNMNLMEKPVVES